MDASRAGTTATGAPVSHSAQPDRPDIRNDGKAPGHDGVVVYPHLERTIRPFDEMNDAISPAAAACRSANLGHGAVPNALLQVAATCPLRSSRSDGTSNGRRL